MKILRVFTIIVALAATNGISAPAFMSALATVCNLADLWSRFTRRRNRS
jgi:hypothetical protein